MKKLFLLAFVATLFSTASVFGQSSAADYAKIENSPVWKYVDGPFPTTSMLRHQNAETGRSTIIRKVGYIFHPQTESHEVIVWILQATPDGPPRLVKVPARVEQAPDWKKLQNVSIDEPAEVPIHMIILTSGAVYGAHFTGN